MKLKRRELGKSSLEVWRNNPVTVALFEVLESRIQNTHQDISNLPMTKMSPESLGLVLAQLEARNTVLKTILESGDAEFSILNDCVDWVE